ncbi:PREDICTED: chromogranin-A [Tinamus guttatus]|uniref:chromogranin-A n=1 Tax=Tinamus guttatus TaxID=94827 RepID=UPI00052EF9EC|nr:PREDICTED: chromogranin-A [Tinamus guttatus]
MKCIVEVISDTLSKPNPLPISEECLETLRGDERIISILRHQNLLKELQEIAVQGASERTQQQKKNSGFEDELSEVLESQNDKNKQRDEAQGHPEEEQPTVSLAELEAEKIQQNEKEDPKGEGKNSLEDREPRPWEARPGEKRDHGEAKSNEIGGTEDSQREEVLDNRISEDLGEEEQKQPEEEEEQPRGTGDSLELEEEREQTSRQGQEESKEETGGRSEREDEQGDTPVEEDPTEAERSLDLAEEDVESEVMQRDDDNEEALGFGKDERSSEEEEEQPYRLKGGRHHLEDEAMQAEEDAFQSRNVKSEEIEEESSREWEDAKRWNKMDELAKQLTSKKRMEENDSGEDPDRSMKMVFRSHKYDFSSPEEDVRRSWKRHSKEDSSEGFPLAAMPEEKKDEEGSANRRTEDQELESLAAIEAELEKVAHKLHELRRG